MAGSKLVRVLNALGSFIFPEYKVYPELKEVVIRTPSISGVNILTAVYTLKGYKVITAGSHEYYRLLWEKDSYDNPERQLEFAKAMIDAMRDRGIFGSGRE